jgi:hypothetical protein
MYLENHMQTEIQCAEQNVLSVAQNLLNVLADVDQETGERAARTAFMAKGWFTRTLTELEIPTEQTVDSSAAATQFFDREKGLKPAENAVFCAAFHYSQYGTQTFSVDDLREIASEAGLVLPDRVDMTLRTVGKDGKKYFQPVGKRCFKLTSHGELHVQKRWQVRPGKSSKAKRGLP